MQKFKFVIFFTLTALVVRSLWPVAANCLGTDRQVTWGTPHALSTVSLTVFAHRGAVQELWADL